MKKQILALTLSIALLTGAGCVAWAADADPFPENRGSSYVYDRSDIPDICFFPAEKARWDGNKVMAADWRKLTDYQKVMFISEYVGELEKKYGEPIDLEGGWEYLGMMSQGIAMVCEEDPGACANSRATTTFDALLFAKGLQGIMPPTDDPEVLP